MPDNQESIRPPSKSGPKTPAGKARSSLNALKHGRYAKHPTVLAIEDGAAFLKLFRDYLAHYNPASPLEARLVQELAHIDWTITRFRALETGFLDALCERDASPFSGLPPAPDPLDRLAGGLARSVDESSFAAFLSLRISRLLTDRDRTLRALARFRRAAGKNSRFLPPHPPENQPQPDENTNAHPRPEE
jgi:hypothetical protein